MVATLFQHCDESKCCAWNRRFESSRVKIGNNATATKTSKKKKTVGLISKTAISNMHHVFHISLPLLHYCDMKMPHFTFNGERKEAMTKLYFSLWTWIWSLGIRLQEGSSGFDKISRRVVFKTDRTLIHFSSEVLVAVASRLWILRSLVSLLTNSNCIAIWFPVEYMSYLYIPGSRLFC